MSLPLNTPTHTPQAFEVERYHMVEQQIRPWNVSNPDILALLGRMHREDFVPAAYRNLAFSDLEIPLREGAAGEVNVLRGCGLMPTPRPSPTGRGRKSIRFS